MEKNDWLWMVFEVDFGEAGTRPDPRRKRGADKAHEVVREDGGHGDRLRCRGSMSRRTSSPRWQYGHECGLELLSAWGEVEIEVETGTETGMRACA